MKPTKPESKQTQQDRELVTIALGDLKPYIGSISQRIDRSMTYVICGIISKHLKVNEPGFKETKKYRID